MTKVTMTGIHQLTTKILSCAEDVQQLTQNWYKHNIGGSLDDTDVCFPYFVIQRTFFVLNCEIYTVKCWYTNDWFW